MTARASVTAFAPSGTPSCYRQREGRTYRLPTYLASSNSISGVQMPAQLLLGHPARPEAAVEGLQRELGRSRRRFAARLPLRLLAAPLSLFNRRLETPPPAKRFDICHRFRRSPETRRLAQEA